MQCEHIPTACWKSETEPRKIQEETYRVAFWCQLREKIGTFRSMNNNFFIDMDILHKSHNRRHCDHAPISVAGQSLDWMSYRQETGRKEKDYYRLISDLVLSALSILLIISSFDWRLKYVWRPRVGTYSTLLFSENVAMLTWIPMLVTHICTEDGCDIWDPGRKPPWT